MTMTINVYAKFPSGRVQIQGLDWSSDKKVEWNPDVERVLLPSGKPLVPEYAMRFVGGSSSKPFSRLWWDETVPTIVMRVKLHNQASSSLCHLIQSIELACIILKPFLLFLYSFQTIIHLLQDRVLTIRENSRLQGFLYYYKLIGPIKERFPNIWALRLVRELLQWNTEDRRSVDEALKHPYFSQR
ncbi:hypothetical protein P3S67_015148 [Capsicum chacoense]